MNELSAASSLLTMTEQIRKTIASAEAVAGEKCAEGDASVSIYRFEGVSKMFDAVISVYNTIRAVRQANTFGFPDNTHTYVSQAGGPIASLSIPLLYSLPIRLLSVHDIVQRCHTLLVE